MKAARYPVSRPGSPRPADAARGGEADDRGRGREAEQRQCPGCLRGVRAVRAGAGAAIQVSSGFARGARTMVKGAEYSECCYPRGRSMQTRGNGHPSRGRFSPRPADAARGGEADDRGRRREAEQRQSPGCLRGVRAVRAGAGAAIQVSSGFARGARTMVKGAEYSECCYPRGRSMQTRGNGHPSRGRFSPRPADAARGGEADDRGRRREAEQRQSPGCSRNIQAVRARAGAASMKPEAT
jgi:coenzyme F420-reducing hydrogenase delta subunit